MTKVVVNLSYWKSFTVHGLSSVPVAKTGSQKIPQHRSNVFSFISKIPFSKEGSILGEVGVISLVITSEGDQFTYTALTNTSSAVRSDLWQSGEDETIRKVTSNNIKNCPTRCNKKQSIYYSASSLYMFRVSTTPTTRSTQNCNYSLRYCAATSFQRGQANLATLEGGSCIKKYDRYRWL